MKLNIIKKPVISEKSLMLANQNNIYTFEVARTANKHQIQETIEKMFKVNVTGIRTISHHRVRKTTGKKRLPTMVAPTKKALVTLKKGQTIDLFDMGGQN